MIFLALKVYMPKQAFWPITGQNKNPTQFVFEIF